MSLRTLLPALSLVALLGMPTPGAAADATAASAPNRRGADPAVVRGLQSHDWTLQSGSDATGQAIEGLIVPGQPFKLRFLQSRLSVQGGCNTMNGGWRLSPQGQLMVGRLAATMKACDAPLMKADAALSAILAQHLSVDLQPGNPATLKLVAPDAQTLVFSGERTPESLYGQATRIFLEVAAQTVPCQPGAGAPTQCLQVRERRYDEKGLRVGEPGAWQAFYGTIQGYTHQPGVRNVLRINRYERPKPLPADASRYVYVLDLVVESELVAK